MEYFEVHGGHKLSGEITPQGAKNEALQILCAVLLTPQPVTISNLPQILDVLRLIDLLQRLGVSVTQLAPDTYRFQALDLHMDYMLTEDFRVRARALRGSVMIMGPLLARYGKAVLPRPGGDKIGRRRLDTHFVGMQKLGAKFDFNAGEGIYKVEVDDRLKGASLLLEEASVTGTANLIMAAVLAEGRTTLYHAACEPYIQQLCHMLVRMGAQIQGIGSNLLIIDGVELLAGTEHRLLADMIEVGSFIGIAAMTGSSITIKNANVDQLGPIPLTFERLGVQLEIRGDDIHVPAQAVNEVDTFIDGSILTISDHTWPGLTPDLLSVYLVVATQCKGTVLIHQKMFESRLFFVDKLIDMGAQIILCDPHRANVIGLARRYPLKAISMTSPDIRAGVALLIAALSAEGTSRIHNIEQIDRGYQNIDGRLRALGAQITRVQAQ